MKKKLQFLYVVVSLVPTVVLAQPDIAARPACAQEGESVGGSTLTSPTACCKGLTVISGYQHHRFQKHYSCAKAKEEGKIPPPGMGGTCTNCGDGVCKDPEDSCSCPADCK